MTQKALLVLAGTICATLAFLTTPAFAKEWQCTLAKGRCPFQLEGKRQQVFKDNGKTSIPFECRIAKGRGELQGRQKDLQYKPTFEECKARVAGMQHKVTVTPGKCEIRLIIQEQKEEKPKKAQGRIEIKPSPCGAEEKPEGIIVKVAGTSCEVKIPPQGGERKIKGFRAEQVEVRKGEREVQITAIVTGLAVVNSPGCGIGEKNEAEYKGKGRIAAKYGIKLR